MRGIDSPKLQLRDRVFVEVARLAYEGWDAEKFHNLPYKIVPGDEAQYRDSVFVDRAIVAEQLRAAMGVSLRRFDQYSSALVGVDASLIDEKYYDPPLIDIISFACNRCPDNRVYITNGCQHCMSHPCQQVCPKNAISFVNGISHIDESKCIKCGLCMNACDYNAIIRQERPCAKACGMKAIKSDEHNRAVIDHDKCVSCGMCLVSCPFGAIVDKSQIFQTITAVKSETPVIAAIAPAFAGQFGNVSAGQIRAAFKALGFADVKEVAIGADLCTVEEAKDYLKEVPDEIPFMLTSCCPAWSVMVKKNFPQFEKYISMALTPMTLTGRMIKKRHPGCKVVFVGPCAAKKLEASRRSIRSDIDFVLTFEEFDAILEARGIDISQMEPDESFEVASGLGVGFAVSGGVAKAVEDTIHQMDPDHEVLIERAEGLENCRKLLMQAKAKKLNGYLLEGMACPGGCVAGAGVVAPIKKATTAVGKRVKSSSNIKPLDSGYLEYLYMIEKDVWGKQKSAENDVVVDDSMEHIQALPD